MTDEAERLAILETKAISTERALEKLSLQMNELMNQSNRVEKSVEKMQTQLKTVASVLAIVWAVFKVLLPYLEKLI